jgi:copper oxidase (laccase) domain-containing protein
MKAVKKMSEKFDSRPGDILLAVGPAIKWCCYEVGDEVVRAVKKSTGEDKYYHRTDGGRHFIDLQTLNVQQALSTGIKGKNISMVEECTHCTPGKYHSYRKSQESADRQGGDRQGGFIGFP